MRKTLLYVGIALSLIGIVFNVLYQFPQETVTTYNETVDWCSGVTVSSYEGQDYDTAYGFYVQASLGDRILISTKEVTYNYGGKWATVFINHRDGTLIYAYPIYSSLPYWSVGQYPLPAPMGGGYYIELGVVPTEASMTSEGLIDAKSLGVYDITVTVRSESVNQNYWLLSMLFLLSGLTVTISGVALKSKNSESISAQ